MARGGAAALAVGGAGWLPGLAASAQAAPAETLNYLTVPEWIGAHEYADFKKQTNITIKEIAYNGSSTRGLAVVVRENPGAYDFLGTVGLAAVPTLLASPSLIAKLDWSKIPNIKYIPHKFRSEYPWGTPTDYGKIGFGYRKDLISERPTSWAEFWKLAPKYSGKIILLDEMEDCMGNTLIMLGYSGNSTVAAQITAAKEKLIEIKPHVQAVLSMNVAQPLVKGTAVMAMDYDFDIALAQDQQKNIVWVNPTEGEMAYLEGMLPVAGSKRLAGVEEWLNFNLAPVNYADFVNTTGTAYLMPAATPLIKKSISQNPILAFSSSVLSKVTFEKDKGAAIELWTTAWGEFQAA